MVILDTNHMTVLEWYPSAPAEYLRRRLVQLPDGDVTTTIVTYEEQVRGWLAKIKSAKRIADEIECYRRLRKHFELCQTLRILDFDERAATEFQRLKKTNPRLGTMDLKIAAIALATGSTVLTQNLRHFQPIDGLDVQDWTQLESET